MVTTGPARAPARAARPRYARLGAASGSLGVTLVTALAAIGVLPTSPAAPGYAATTPTASQQAVHGVATRVDTRSDGPGAREPGLRAPSGVERGIRGTSAQPTAPQGTGGAGSTSTIGGADTDAPLPAGSGTGTRVVFSQSQQRVWLVGGHGEVLRTYLVSGSLTDNLDPGTYQVYSKSRHAWGIDDSGTMEFMVRFATGENAAIGFHSIPVKDGHLVQSRAQLGTPTSHGCIRQTRHDAKQLWRFTDVGTTVVVV